MFKFGIRIKHDRSSKSEPVSTASSEAFHHALVPAAVLLLDGLTYYKFIYSADGRSSKEWGDRLWISWVIVSVFLMLCFALWFLYRGNRDAQGSNDGRCAAVESAIARAARCMCGSDVNDRQNNSNDGTSANLQRQTITPQLEAPLTDRQEINEGAGWLRNTSVFDVGQSDTFRLMIMPGEDDDCPVPPINGPAGVKVSVNAKSMHELVQGIMNKLELERDVELCEKDEDTNSYASYADFDFVCFPRKGRFHLRWKEDPDQAPAPASEPDSGMVQWGESDVEPEAMLSAEEWLEDRKDQDRRTYIGGIFAAVLGGTFAVMGCECGVIDWVKYGSAVAAWSIWGGAVSGAAVSTWTETAIACLFMTAAGFVGSRSENNFVGTLVTLANFDEDAQADARAKVRYMLLVFCQVGYVFLVSSSLEPLTCTKDVDKKWYMVANPMLECNWCAEEKSVWASDDSSWRDLSYPAIASASYFFASLYAVGIPLLFFGIMFSNRARLRTQKFNKAYGFLTSKTSERFYWWECAIISKPTSNLQLHVPSVSFPTGCLWLQSES